MAFPTISQIVNSRQTATVSSHPVTIPSDLEPGSILLLIEFCHGNLALQSHPAGFVRLASSPAVDGSGNVNVTLWTYVYSPALLPVLGVERPRPAVPGGVITLTTTATRRSDVYACAFAEKFFVSYFLTAISNGGATAIDAPNLAYSATAKDVLWLAIGTGINFTLGTYPTNYSLYQRAHSGGGQGNAIAGRELNAASENPGAFGGAPNPNSDWHAMTLGVALTAT